MAQFKVGDRVKAKFDYKKYEGIGTVEEVFEYDCLIKFDETKDWMHGKHDEWFVLKEDIEHIENPKEIKSELAERFVELLALAVSREGSNELREEVIEFKYRLIEKGLVTHKEIDNALMSYLNNEAFNKKIEEEMRGE